MYNMPIKRIKKKYGNIFDANTQQAILNVLRTKKDHENPVEFLFRLCFMFTRSKEH